MSGRICFDAEGSQLPLPDHQRIRLKDVKDLTIVATKLGKPIIHQLVDGYVIRQDSIAGKRTGHILVVYDAWWVYYCEIQEGSLAKEDVKPQ